MRLVNKLFIICCIICVQTYSFAQEIKKTAWVTTLMGRTESVKIIIPMNLSSGKIVLSSLSEKIQYYNKKEVREFTPYHIESIYFYIGKGNKKQKILLVSSCVDPNSRERVFLQQMNYGYLRIFQFHYGENKLTRKNDHYVKTYVQKGESKLFLYDIHDYSAIKSYFSDCPKLVKKLEEKKFSTLDLQKMVTLYNKSCASKSKKLEEEKEPVKYKVDY